MSLVKCSKTYSGSFTGYIMEYGIQLILFRTCDRDKVDSLCKEFSTTLKPHQKIYVEEVFCCHTISKFKL